MNDVTFIWFRIRTDGMVAFGDHDVYSEENFLTSGAVINFTRTSLVHGVTYSQLQVLAWEI
jgi:hypothetical protein